MIDAVPAGAPLIAVLDAASAAIAQEWEGDPKLFPDVAMVAARYLFRGHVTQMVSPGQAGAPGQAGGAPQASEEAPKPPTSARPDPRASTTEPRSLTSAALAQRFGAAAERGQLSRLLPPESLASLCLLNLFAATLAWCADPTVRPLGVTLAGMSRLFLDGVRGPVV
jgi:hypothetical protein